ncbi:MAG: winged helix-turn-helix transcriptional regulator [Gammaproteobacteria bacterium]|nr:winged helix-turn-helix transcriptional regulator [Gammaproteobacteria bacterium]
MTVTHSVAEVLRSKVQLEVECIDRMYLNVYVPQLQYPYGVVSFFRQHRGHQFASSALMKPISDQFVAQLGEYARQHQIPLIRFTKGQRKDDVAKQYLRGFSGKQGLLFIGVAQEKSKVFRTEGRRNPQSGQRYAWIVPSTALVNHYYCYAVDEDFGPFFLKFGSYFPYNAKLCINGHEYLKRQLTKHGIGFEALDNGILSCKQPERLQELCEGLTSQRIDALLRKWLELLPHPFTPRDRQFGYRYQLSILQAEFSLTQVLDRPVTGRMFFEQVIRENLDLGRPQQVQLIFDRRLTRRTPTRCRTRVVTQGVIPSLHVDYKNTRIKQYHKEGRALRTETTINDTYDFGISRGLHHLPALKAIGFAANRRLLQVQRISHDCTLGQARFATLQAPVVCNSQRAAALRFGDPRVLALFQVLILFCLQPQGFRNADLRQHYAGLLGLDPTTLTQGQLTYQLRRLRLHGLIERIPRTHRYRLTDFGLRATLFLTRLQARAIQPGLALIDPLALASDHRLQRLFNELSTQVNLLCQHEKLAA